MTKYLISFAMFLACTIHADDTTNQLLLTSQTYHMLAKQAKAHPTPPEHPDHDHEHETYDAEPEKSAQYKSLQALLDKLIFIPTLKENNFIIALLGDAVATQSAIRGRVATTQMTATLLKSKEPNAHLQMTFQVLGGNIDKQDKTITDIVTIFSHSQPQNLEDQASATQAVITTLGNLTLDDDLHVVFPATAEGFTFTEDKISQESSEKIIDEIEKAQNLGVLEVNVVGKKISCQQLKDEIAAQTYSAPPPPPVMTMEELKYTSPTQSPTTGEGLIVSQKILTAIQCSAGIFISATLGIARFACGIRQYPSEIFTNTNRALLWQRFLTQVSHDLGNNRYSIHVPSGFHDQVVRAKLTSMNLWKEQIKFKDAGDVLLGTIFDIMQPTTSYFEDYQKAETAAATYMLMIHTILSIQIGDSLENNKKLFKAAVKGFVKNHCKYYQNWHYYIRTRAINYTSAKKLDTTPIGRQFLQLLQQAKKIFGNLKMSLDRENKTSKGLARANEGLTLQQMINYINK